MTTYFITGITGFLGLNIAMKLAKDSGAKIIGFANKINPNITFFKENNIDVIIGDILNKNDIDKFLDIDADEKILIHSAGRITTFKKHGKLTMDINYLGTKNMVDGAIKHHFSKFIYISSVDSLNKTKDDEIIVEQDYYDVNKVDGVYSKSKVLANNYVLDAYKEKGLNAIIILPSAILGPNDPFSAPINVAIKKYLNNKLPAIVKGGYDLVDVRDVSNAVILAANSDKYGTSYIINGHRLSVYELINMVATLENKKLFKRVVPRFLIKIASPFIELFARIRRKTPLFTGFSMDCLMQNSNYSCEKAKKELGYSPRELNDTLVDTIKFLKNN